jgi:hypothetical protein
MSNPYQIREGLLHLARDILESQSRANEMEKTNAAVPYGRDKITSEQIITEAESLNAFVSGANDAKILPSTHGVESRRLEGVRVKINGIPFLLEWGTLTSHKENWKLVNDALGSMQISR